MRHQQAAEAKRLAAEQRQRSGLLKEQAKLREAERAEKSANEERLKTPLAEDPAASAAKNDQLPKNPVGTTTAEKEQQLDPRTGLPTTEVTNTEPQGPTGTPTEDPEILPDKETTP